MLELVIDLLMDTTVDNARSEAFEQVVTATRRPLLLFLVRLLGDPEEALDVLQETFARAATQRGFLDDDFNRTAWLYRVAGNLGKSTLRRLKRMLRLSPAPAEVPAPLERILDNEKRVKVQNALARLDFGHRQVILLRFYLDLSYSEIAEVLSVPIGTVMSRLNRAKAQLERSLR
ncbi:MAG: RNA polymerase sigma factor [Candidatus Riflebacteria bacterium]|nr:RNA polymerase sigma factor [Candidatus Riflebacteria bacterium]